MSGSIGCANGSQMETRRLEATSGFEPEMKALQASALPLGHVAPKANLLSKRADPSNLIRPAPAGNGADNGVRTRDPHLGKVVLYQLSHVRIAWNILLEAFRICKTRICRISAAVQASTALR